MKARENAANDIFERMNASGSMGTLSANTLLKIDIHGLHVKEAKAQITEYVLPVLQVVSKVILITGRGRHGASGASILKPAMEAFLRLVNVNFKDVPGNDGAIWIYSLKVLINLSLRHTNFMLIFSATVSPKLHL